MAETITSTAGGALPPRDRAISVVDGTAPQKTQSAAKADEDEAVGPTLNRVAWVDSYRGESLAEVFEYAAEEAPATPSRQAAVLALEDVHAGAPGALEEVVKLPPQTFAARDSWATPEPQLPIQAKMEWPLATVDSTSGSAAAPGQGAVSALALAEAQPKEDLEESVMPCENAAWQQLSEGGRDLLPPSQVGAAGNHGHLHPGHASEQLQLVMYQQRELVLYDRFRNRVFARRLTEEQANALARSRHSFCPLCRQHLDPAWAFVVEGYFDVISNMSTGTSTSSSGNNLTASSVDGFGSNEEAAAACGLHNIPVGLLNCGYYKRFFVEEKKLGAGSFGAVYLCRHVMDEIELGVFAVKKLALGDDTTRLRQVIREVKALERMRHMNIIDYKHSWLEVSRHSEFCPYVPFLFILMEYCNAGSLEDLIWPQGFVRGAQDNAARATMLTEELIWLLFLDVCRGLRHLHGRGILHRDLKPSNILLHVDEIAGETSSSSSSQVPRALLSDFGTCEILGEGAAVSGHVHGGYAIEFMAPERLRGEESDEPADMWSAGLVLYAMCYGDIPYHSDDPTVCRAKVMAHMVLSDLPDFREQALRGLISGLTARAPVARPTAEEAERVSFAAACRCRAEGEAAKARPSPQLLPSLPAPSPLELMDETAAASQPPERAPASSEPPAKILRISSDCAYTSPRATSAADDDGV